MVLCLIVCPIFYFKWKYLCYILDNLSIENWQNVALIVIKWIQRNVNLNTTEVIVINYQNIKCNWPLLYNLTHFPIKHWLHTCLVKFLMYFIMFMSFLHLAESYGLIECTVNCSSWHQLERCSVQCTGSPFQLRETENDCECVFTHESNEINIYSKSEKVSLIWLNHS